MKKGKRTASLDVWQAGGPLGSANGNCDTRNGGGNFGGNAFNTGLPKNTRGERSLLRLIAVLLGVTVLVAAAAMVLCAVLKI